ncbi:MAG: zinc ribbon domain-containing protein [Deltaproteobacteria bacterium]|nr:zinc ribbon domain-containing protein [Deltaproteobacteria bacterium]
MTPCSVNKKSGKKIGYYRCTSTFKRGWSACSIRHVNADRMESWVENLLGELTATPALIERAIAASNKNATEHLRPLREKEAALVERAKAITAGLKNLVEVLKLGGAAALPMVQREIEQGEQDRTLLEAELANVREEVALLSHAAIDAGRVQEVLKDFQLIYRLATPRERQELIHLLLKKVVFAGKEKPVSVELFDRSSVEVKESSYLCTKWRGGRDLNPRPPA